MNISFEKSTPVSGTITIQLVKADYAEKVNEALKKMSQKAQMPGFRPGKVPFSLVNKMYGPQAKMEEVNKLLSDKLFGYIKEQKLEVRGEPMGNESQAPQDIENQDDFEFKFDIALAPEFSIELNKKDKVDYYEIEVDDAQVNSQIEEMTRQAGHPEDVEEYRDGDILRGPLTELDEQGQPKEGGIQVERASLMPNYFKAVDQKKLFDGAKKNDVITFKPAEAHSDVEAASLLKVKKDEVAQHAGDFSFQVEEISRFVPSELDQKLFDRIFGEGQVKSEEEFRAAGFRAVPGAVARRGSFIGKNTVLMPSYVNIGAYVDEGAMVDTWATVGSCAQIGKNVHLSGGVGIGGVLEPLQAAPTIIEDNCFIGARSEIVEGVIVEEGSVISMGVYIGQSTKIYDRETGEIHYGRVPAGSVVVSGSLPAKDGSHSLYCAVIVKKVDAQTRAKTSVNELLRGV